MQGEAKKALQKVADESVHAVVTDPPYGLTAAVDIQLLLEKWLTGFEYINEQNGYAGVEWDNAIPDPGLWREVYRVLKPGAFVIAFSSSRTVHLLTISLQLSGFEIRDQIHWVYKPGRPTSGNLGKIEKQYADFRATLRPSHEPILVARKPLDDGYSLVENLESHGTGALNHQALVATGEIASNVMRVHSSECSKTGTTCTCMGGNDIEIATHLYEFLEEIDGCISVSKPNGQERPKGKDGTTHETVKPLHLVRRLIRAVTLPGQTVLDPFLGSGTTTEAALLERRNVIGCEMTAKYWELTEKRVERVRSLGMAVRSSAQPNGNHLTSTTFPKNHGELKAAPSSKGIWETKNIKGKQMTLEEICPRCGESIPPSHPIQLIDRQVCGGCSVAQQIEQDLEVPAKPYILDQQRNLAS